MSLLLGSSCSDLPCDPVSSTLVRPCPPELDWEHTPPPLQRAVRKGLPRCREHYCLRTRSTLVWLFCNHKRQCVMLSCFAWMRRESKTPKEFLLQRNISFLAVCGAVMSPKSSLCSSGRGSLCRTDLTAAHRLRVSARDSGWTKGLVMLLLSSAAVALSGLEEGPSAFPAAGGSASLGKSRPLC